MEKKRRKPNNETGLQEIARILAAGVLRMQDAHALLSSPRHTEDPDLQKPPKHVNQRVSG